jgi:hypothetical protein
MPDVLKNPRVRELLSALADADRLRDQLDDAHEVDEARDTLLRDLGLAVFTLARTYGESMLPVEPGDPHSEALYTDEVPLDDDTGWYTSEVPKPSGSLFEPGDIEDGTTDIPESTEGPYGEHTQEVEDYQIENVARMQLRRDEAGNPMAELSQSPAPTWRHNVDTFRELLKLPADPDDPDELAVEASKVQWATSELDKRLTPLPGELQVCFIGLLAARAHHLREKLDVGVGPRLALDRLDRYRLTNDLPAVAGLLATPRPEYGSWVNDMRHWFDLLTPRHEPS